MLKIKVRYFPAMRNSIDIQKNVPAEERMKLQFKIDKVKTQQKYEKLLQPTLKAFYSIKDKDDKSKLRIRTRPTSPSPKLHLTVSSPKNFDEIAMTETIQHTPRKETAKLMDYEKTPISVNMTPSTQMPPSISISIDADTKDQMVEPEKIVQEQQHPIKLSLQQKSDRLQSFLKRRARRVQKKSQIEIPQDLNQNDETAVDKVDKIQIEKKSDSLVYSSQTEYIFETKNYNDEIDVKRCDSPIYEELIKKIN